ncbi:MAG: outer membrane protein assembly factor BamA [Candidatus Korobacteraceae bacterium]
MTTGQAGEPEPQQTPALLTAQETARSIPAAVHKLPAQVVARVEIQGTPMATAPYIVKLIEQKTGAPVDREAIRRSIRRLYQTQLFDTIDVVSEPAEAEEIVLIFRTTPHYFVGLLTVDGLPKDGPRASEMISSATLELGLQYSPERLQESLERMHRLLEDNGYYQAKITYVENPDPATQQMSVNFHVVPGGLSRIGRVTLTGSPGLSPEQVEDFASLHPGDKVQPDQVQRALRRLRKRFQKGKRLEAQVAIARSYNAANNTVDYTIEVRRGPLVEIMAEGARISRGQLKKQVPVYQEGSTDEDLLDEGRRNLRDFLQSEGYFNAKVSLQQKREEDSVRIVYEIDHGSRHRLANIRIEGGKYFDQRTLRERMSSQVSSWLLPKGSFSPSLLVADVAAIKTLYRENGFPDVQVTGSVVEDYQDDPRKLQALIQIEEGRQVLVRNLTIAGNRSFPEVLLRQNLYNVPGQPYSLANATIDRETLVNFYFNQGFPQVQFEATAKPVEGDPAHMDVAYTITEGERVYVENVLVSGLSHTRRSFISRRFTLHGGDPLDQSKMAQTQSRLYDLGIFNEVNMAVQNPGGQVERKNVVYQLQEARRYTFHFGVGIEFATGSSPGSNPQGNTGISPTGAFSVTRNNFRGKDESLTFQAQVGNLIKRAQASFEQPHWFEHPNLHFTYSFLYDNTRDVNTFTAERLGGSFQLQQRLTRADRLVYGFSYRRDKVDPSSFPAGFSPDLASLYAAPVRIGMPSITYLRDTRDNPLASTKGSFTTADFGVATGWLGSEANFGRILAQNSTYHRFGNGYVFARSTRIGIESPYGSSKVVPLPEHFFAGGSNSLRGFSLNQAGPRDPISGFPIGGNAMFVNNFELRTPPATLPLAGPGFNFVIFHDAGNVFDTVSHMWTSVVRWSQSNQEACKTLIATCDFNYIAQAVGGGLRYLTPIGPLRLDISYALNPAFFKVEGTTSHIDRLRRFNLSFSIGQTF